jgi:glutaredoxin
VTAATARVEVVVTPGCHLCEAASAVVAEVCEGAGIGWRTVALTDLAEDRQAEWRNYVPVILIDGAVHDIFRVDPTRLGEALFSSTAVSPSVAEGRAAR